MPADRFIFLNTIIIEFFLVTLYYINDFDIVKNKRRSDLR